MDAKSRIEQVLNHSLDHATKGACPPKLAEAVKYSVFPGGARIRPKLCLAVACANGELDPELSNAACAAIELLHCASLVHDDMPCFDNADERRGKPTVHVKYGEQIALLTGDALIVHAFETVGLAINQAHAQGRIPKRLPQLLTTISRSVGAPSGIVAGQAWECEEATDISKYHQSKTGSLFVAATCCGAIASGADPESWVSLGKYIGEAYQIADDILDATAPAGSLGKPVGNDVIVGSPNIVSENGLEYSISRLEELITKATVSVPSCVGRDWLRDLIVEEAKQFIPNKDEQATDKIIAELGTKQRLSTFDDAIDLRGMVA